MWYSSFSVWLTSLSLIICRPSMLLQMAWLHSFCNRVICHCIYAPHPISGHLGGFHVLATVKRASRNTGVPRSGSYSNSVFSFWRNLHIVLPNGFTNLHSHQQYRKFPFSPYLLQHLFYCVFFDDGHSDPNTSLLLWFAFVCLTLQTLRV